VETTLQQRWQLALATSEALRGWQPNDEPTCVLETVEAVALGREAEPAIRWTWRQGESRYQDCLTVQDLIEAVDYDEMLEPPEAPAPDDWLGLVCLTVYEPQGKPPGAPPGVRWCFDYLP
jgi:hypothetical protein